MERLRSTLTKKHRNAIVLTALDDICWLLNIRGDDVQYNPVVYGYVFVTMDAVHLFIHKGRDVHAEGINLIVHDYDSFLPFLEEATHDRPVLRRERGELRREEGDSSSQARVRLQVREPTVS